MSNKLHVFSNGDAVGSLINNKGSLKFKYDDDWLSSPSAYPISLIMPLSDEVFEGSTVYNYLDGLLPDNPLIRSRIQSKFNIKTNTPFDILCIIGKDCVGAMQFITDENLDYYCMQEQKTMPLNEKMVARLLRGYESNPMGMSDVDDFRISIAGAQEKTALHKDNGRWFLPMGATPTTHILKLPIGKLSNNNIDLSDSCDNEWFCMNLAANFGLKTAKADIETFEDQRVLVVERFDRKKQGGKYIRLPQEDFCQVLGISPASKYECDGGPGIKSIMDVLRSSENASDDRQHFFRSQILFYMLTATDGHAKNFSLSINARGGFSLSPLYDILSVSPLIDSKQIQKQKVKMAMALDGSNRHYHHDKMMPRHFISTAKKVGYKDAKSDLEYMFDTTEKAIDMTLAKTTGSINEQTVDSIIKGVKKIVNMGLNLGVEV